LAARESTTGLRAGKHGLHDGRREKPQIGEARRNPVSGGQLVMTTSAIPHLTIGDRPDGGPGVLRPAEAEVRAALSVRTHVSRGWLMAGRKRPVVGSCAPPPAPDITHRGYRTFTAPHRVHLHAACIVTPMAEP
jgi:hypothetical protein